LPVDTLGPKIGDACRPRRINSWNRYVLDMLGNRERTRLEYEDAMAMRDVPVEQMLGQRSTKSATAYDNDVEWARISSYRLVGRGERFV
jgi:hypothetical protein